MNVHYSIGGCLGGDATKYGGENPDGATSGKVKGEGNLAFGVMFMQKKQHRGGGGVRKHQQRYLFNQHFFLSLLLVS